MKKILIVIGAAKYNMGSNMLLRGIVKIVKELGIKFVFISSADTKKHEGINIPFVHDYIPRYFNFLNKYYINKFFSIIHRLCPISIIETIRNYPLYRKFKFFDLIILIAADNYDYNNRKNSLDEMISYISKFKNKPKIVLYDLSINKENITQYLKESIKKKVSRSPRFSSNIVRMPREALLKSISR